MAYMRARASLEHAENERERTRGDLRPNHLQVGFHIPSRRPTQKTRTLSWSLFMTIMDRPAEQSAAIIEKSLPWRPRMESMAPEEMLYQLPWDSRIEKMASST